MQNSNQNAEQALGGLAQAMLAQVQDKIDQAIDRKVEEAKEKLAGPKRIEIHKPNGDKVIVKGHVHPIFEEVCNLTSAGLNVLLVGPAGSGKTHLTRQVAVALGLPYYSYSVSEATTEANLFGRLLPLGEGGQFTYAAAPFIKMYEKGGLVCMDEIDAGLANVFTALNSALAQDSVFSDLRDAVGQGGFIRKHSDFRCIAAANTFGEGGSAVYAGRNQLDGATLDRFVSINMDYDKTFEETLAPANVCEWVWSVRDRINRNNMRKIAGTRMIAKVATMIEAGMTFQRAKQVALSGWSQDDILRVS